jgi:hypothetical protein
MKIYDKGQTTSKEIIKRIDINNQNNQINENRQLRVSPKKKTNSCFCYNYFISFDYFCISHNLFLWI